MSLFAPTLTDPLRVPHVTFGLLLAALLIAGCDFASSYSVRGEVVDAVTGEPVSPGNVRVSVFGEAMLLDALPPLIGEAETRPDGHFDILGMGDRPDEVRFQNDTHLDYPIPETLVNEPWINGLRRAVPIAYYGASTDFSGQDVGRVELAPTCLTVGDLRLASPIPEGQYLQIEMTAQGQKGNEAEFALVGFPVFVYDTTELGAVLEADSVRFLARGGHAARLAWSVRDLQTSDQVESGGVLLPTCPRHGVLSYNAVIGPSGNGV